MRLDKNKMQLIMAQNGLNQKDLSEKAGYSRGYVSMLINGKNCQPKTINRLSCALGVNVTEIVSRDSLR